MNFTAEELRRLWLDLYRDEVSRLASKGVDRDSLHSAASAHADRHVKRLADQPQAPAAEMERVPVESVPAARARSIALKVPLYGARIRAFAAETARAARDAAAARVGDSSTFAPDWISPPGDTIEDLLEERSWTKAEFAERTGFTPKHINELVKGRVPITADAAERLSRVLGSTSDFWLVRDAQYQAACERQRAIKSAVEDAAWLSELPPPLAADDDGALLRTPAGDLVLALPLDASPGLLAHECAHAAVAVLERADEARKPAGL